LLVLQWVAAIAISVWITPRAWNGTASGIHPDPWEAVFLGGIICFIPLLLRADVAISGSEVLRASGQTPYDVILIDCHMPVIGGYEVTEMIQERESLVNRHAKLHTHIVALTVGAMKGDREKCLAAGRDDYLSKPMCIDDLSVALARSRKTDPGCPI
jgi:CheY-like chemotaxis protein